MKIKYFKSAFEFRQWLEVNHARVSELWVGFFKKDSGQSGLTAPRTLATAEEKQFKADKIAWEFFQRQPPGYQRPAIWWVVSAKKPETRARRLGQLIADSHKGHRLGQVSGSRRK